MNCKNVLVVTDYAAPYEGNFIESFKSLKLEYEKSNDNIIFLFPLRASKLNWIQDLIRNDKWTIYFFDDDTVVKCANKIKELIKKENIRVIYTHVCRHKTQAAVKSVSFSNKNIKIVSHFHNHCKTNLGGLKGNVIKKLYKLYEGDVNIGCSESVAKTMPYKSNKVYFVNNAINFNRLDNVNNVELFDKSKFNIIMFGFDYYRKGIDLAIKAIKELKASNDKCKNIILNISFASNLEKAKQNIMNEFGEIPDFVKFVEPINDIGSYYSNCDLFISAAREEGFCYSIVEAAYCGCKVLSSNISGVPKEIPGELLFESNNVESLKNQIIKSIDYDGSKKQEAILYVKKQYKIENWAKDIKSIIDKV